MCSLHAAIHSASTTLALRGDVRDQKTRMAITQLDKTELEDKHYRLMEENLVSICTCVGQSVSMYVTLVIGYSGTKEIFTIPRGENEKVRIYYSRCSDIILHVQNLIEMLSTTEWPLSSFGLPLMRRRQKVNTLTLTLMYTHNTIPGSHRHGNLETDLDDALFKNRDLQKQNAALKSKVT